MAGHPILALPNLLSLSRFPLAVAFVLWESAPARVVLLVLAALSDLLDGWLARKREGASRLGALLDPIADKTFVLAALLVFLAGDSLSVRDFLIILSRDIATLVGFLVAWRRRDLDPKEFRARWLGKVTTVLQLIALLVLIVRPQLLPPLIPIIAIASAAAIVDYTRSLARARA
ncbi:MAG TPA: CDP-alcohol phosphatidyltransferase family protein [Gemmatimonadaceae bacterium]|nr:CDP-alcohol phosphatidyltransferase family protein [Gemmatimonadaceae bacterium]